MVTVTVTVTVTVQVVSDWDYNLYEDEFASHFAISEINQFGYIFGDYVD